MIVIRVVRWEKEVFPTLGCGEWTPLSALCGCRVQVLGLLVTLEHLANLFILAVTNQLCS